MELGAAITLTPNSEDEVTMIAESITTLRPTVDS